MTPQIYIKLLSAIEELRRNILEINPNANIIQLDDDMRRLYDMVNDIPSEAKDE